MAKSKKSAVPKEPKPAKAAAVQQRKLIEPGQSKAHKEAKDKAHKDLGPVTKENKHLHQAIDMATPVLPWQNPAPGEPRIEMQPVA